MQNENQIRQILKQYKLKQTTTRAEILRLYLDKKHALAHKDIELTLSEQFDRVTIYRTLNTFEEKGIIHKIFDGSSSVKYALCGEECQETEETHDHQHHHNHVHFTCNNCEKTFCIDEIDVPQVKLPSKFKTENVFLVARGTCENCD